VICLTLQPHIIIISEICYIEVIEVEMNKMVVHRSIELHQEAAMGTFAIMNDLILAVLSFIVSFSFLISDLRITDMEEIVLVRKRIRIFIGEQSITVVFYCEKSRLFLLYLPLMYF